MLLHLRSRLLNPNFSSLLNFSYPNAHKAPPFSLTFRASISQNPNSQHASAAKPSRPVAISEAAQFAKTVLFVPPGIDPDDVTEDMVLPGSNILLGPYAGDAKIKEVDFVKSSNRPKDCPKDDRPEFAMLGRSNVGKSSLINFLVRKKDVALTSKKPGKTQLINHFLVNKSWYIVDLPGYGLVSVLLLIDASVPPQKIDLDCANWLGRNEIPMTFVFTKCDKMKGGKGKRPDENIRDFQELIKGKYRQHPPWIMTSSVTGLGRDELLLHMSQLRNYWDNE
ncbi:GTP-binding protein at2g22870 [Phtheirospermum japonicum]|uniref:GTP-binding protein at2g22870 n=1 Tax=Phtheirospermum japonicum TaxID=374723 RepID=A0A830BA42_9LAMI|nr:GTP-binding protein at2g22870 [Phtheirospermum japonicum]